MAENKYAERGNSTFNIDQSTGTITYPNEDVARKINYRETSGGHLRGFVQPANDHEKRFLKKMRTQIEAGTYQPENVPDYAQFGKWETHDGDGVIFEKTGFLIEDVTIKDQPIILYPNEIFLFDNFDKLNPDEIEKGEVAAIDGYHINSNGQLYNVPIWRHKNKEGQTFYAGRCEEFDLAQHLAARQKGKNSEIPFDADLD